MKARQQLRPIYDAAWELCRIGVLRPGRGVQRSCSSRHRGPPGDVAAWPAALGHGRDIDQEAHLTVAVADAVGPAFHT